MSILRKFQRKQDQALVSGEPITEAQKRYPTGKVVSSPIKGEYLTFPLLGWMAVRAQESTPLVMLALALLKDDRIRGTLHVEIPIYEGETDKAAFAALERFGWNGRVWEPGADTWPTGDAANEEQLKMLLDGTGLRATLTFPPDSETNNVQAQTVEVMRANGPFFMEPLAQPETEPDPEKFAAFMTLCREVARFHRLN
jgi:hypothetical protein